MSLENWDKIKEIYFAADELAAGDERERYLREVCAGDEELRRAVEKLLGHEEAAENLMSRPLMDVSGVHVFAEMIDNSDPLIGRQIGAYRLEKEIGRGGMGAVYLAARADGSFRQSVAIKLIKRGMDTDFILRRFRQERQILASLNHPNIARLLDGGTTTDGLPYFVMEFIEGKPLYKYADEEKLSIKERLKLFRQICKTLDFAHQNEVIHRDIKPPNILILEDGTPKLLDFGIAKVLNPEIGISTIDPTATAMRLMTPEYASPEQVCGLVVTPASDIYSLGVLLYELLTGHRPYRFRNRAPHEIARVICEEEPDRPSTGITREDNLLPTAASEATTLRQIYLFRGATNIEDLQKELAGDIERVILKCLRKEPLERYQTAAELAEDIDRYLDGKPVKAETRFAAAVLLGSNKNSDLKSLAVLPLKILNPLPNADTGEDFLSVGLADALISRLSGIKRLVVRPTGSVLRLNTDDPFAAGRELGVDFIVDGNIWRAGSKIRVTAQLLNVRENSTNWSESFDEHFTDVLALEDLLSERVVKSLILKLTGEEEKQLNKRGTSNADAYEAFLRGRVNWNLQSEEGFARAIGFYNRAVELDPNYALAYAAIAEYYIFLGIHCVIPFEKGARAAKQAAEQAIRLDPMLAEGYASLGFAIVSFDLDWNKAAELFARAVEVNPNSISAHFWRAAISAQTKRFDEALRELKITNELDPDSFLNLHMTAWVYYHARRFDESIGIHRQTLEIEPNYAWGLQTYSWALRRGGEFKEAIIPAERAVQLTGENPFYLTSLAAAYADAGEATKAEEILAQLEEISKTKFVSEYMLALVYCALKDKDRAFENLEKSFAARDGWLNWLGVEPQFDVLRDDARYDDLMRRAGNPLAKPIAAKATAPITNSEKSIAVLPLKLLGTPTGSDDEYLGIGLADALVTRLSNVRRLVVRPTSSVLPFGDNQTNPFAAGKELGVNYVLDGNIRRVGERIRVTVQLLSVNENSTNWAESFNERFTDVLELEDSISERVVKSLIPKLTGEEQQKLQKRGTNSPEAFEAYMRGRFRWNQFTPDSLEKACEAFQAAIKLDPNYALPHVGLADFYIWSNIYGMIPSSEAVALAQASANRAIELDAQLGEAYASLGLTYQNRFSWARAYELYEQALKLAPNYVHAHEWYAASLVGHGNFEKGIEEIKIAERLDPLSLRTKTLTAWTLYQAHRFDDALERGQQIIELEANYPQGNSQIGIVLLAQGKAEEALPHLQKFDAMIPNSGLAKFQLCFALVAAGQHTEARKVLEDIKTLAANAYVKPFFLAMAHAALDERDEAFPYFEQAARESEPWMLWFGTEPMLENLRGDERYEDILRLMNNPLAKPKKEKLKQPAASDEKSIAVLPLTLLGTTLSGSGDDEFLCVGLADALITRLSNVRRLVVRPTASVLPYDKKSTDGFAAGGELKVNFVVDGTIRRVGKRIRVSAQLLDVRNHSTVWAQAFDEDFSDVLALEDSISNKIAKSLLPKLTGEEEKRLGKRGTNSPEAFEAYMRGRYFATQFSEDALEKSLAAYSEAVQLDPDYALPRVGIAEFYVWTSIMGAIPTGDAYPKAKEELHLAHAADDALAEAFALSALVALLYDWNWTEAERLAKRAIEINPNYYAAHDAYAHILASHGDFDEAIAEIKRAEELDPLSPRAKIMVSCISYQARRFDLSTAKAEEAVRMECASPQGLLHLGNALVHGATDSRAVEALTTSVNLWGKTAMNKFMLCFALVARNRHGEAETVLQQILKLADTHYVKSYFVAMAHVALGKIDAAFEWFEKSIEDRDDWLLWFGTDIKLDVLRNDARYFEILEKTGSPIIARQKPKIQPNEGAAGEAEKPTRKRGADNPEAFEAYLRGRHYWNSFTEEGFAKSLIFYNQAIALAPDYALAYAGIADYYNSLGVYAVFPFAETSAAAMSAARKAIELEPDSAEAHAAYGFAVATKDFDWKKAEHHFRRAVELNSNYALARIWYGYFLTFCGRFDEALAHVERAIEIDRFAPIAPQTLNWILYHARRSDEAIAATRRFVKDEPRYGLTFLFFGSMLWHVGQFEEAVKTCLRAVELLGRTPYTLVWLASAHAAAGDRETTLKLIEEIEALAAHRYVSPYLTAMLYSNLNDAGNALTHLEKALKIRDGRLLWLGVDPQFESLRHEPRFERILRETNNPQIARQII